GRAVGLDRDFARPGVGPNVLAEVKSSYRNRPVRGPPRNRFAACLRVRLGIFRTSEWNLLSGGDQRPVRRIVELHIELSRAQTEVRIPGAALANIEQSISCLRQYIAAVTEKEFQFLAG